jgi:hypothetical protein
MRRVTSVPFALLFSVIGVNAIEGKSIDDEPKPSGPYCGLYCVYGALQILGKEVPFESLLRPKYMKSREGSSIEELKTAFIDAGIDAVAMEGLSGASLHAVTRPMILHVASDGQLREYDHWVLFCGIERGLARILDAPNAMEQVPIADLLARYYLWSTR